MITGTGAKMTMTEDERVHLDNVVAAPDNLAARLRYAAYLDRRGDPRGEFIRLHTLACRKYAPADRFGNGEVMPPGGFSFEDGLQDNRLIRRCRELFPEAVRLSPLSRYRNTFDGSLSVGWNWRNGFPNQVICRANAWTEFGLRIMDAAPITSLIVTHCGDAAAEIIAAGSAVEALDQIIFLGARPTELFRHVAGHAQLKTKFFFCPSVVGRYINVGYEVMLPGAMLRLDGTAVFEK